MNSRLRALAAALLLFTPYGVAQSGAPAYRIQTLAGSANAGDGGLAAQALLLQAEGIVWDPSGALFVADAGDHRVRRIAPNGVISTYAGTGAAGYSGDNGPAADAQLSSPYGLAVDNNGNLYIADLGNRAIRRVDRNGRITTVAGGGALPAEPASEGSPATAVSFLTPRNVAIDADANLYISDFDAHRIYVVTAGTFRLYAGTGSPGYGANDIPAVRSALRNPAGLWVDGQGGLLVAEAGAQRIRRIVRGTISAYPAAQFGTPLYGPTAVAIDANGSVYVTDARPGASLKRTSSGQVVTLTAGGRAIAVDPFGNAYLADGAVVSRVTASGSVSQVVSGAGGAFLGDNGPAAAARLHSPAAVALDAAGQIYLADELNHRVRRIAASGEITTVAGTGSKGYSGDGGPGNKAQLNAPRGLAFDRSGNLLIADSGNHVIRRLTPAGLLSTVAGTNFNGFRGDGGPAPLAMLDTPSGLAADPVTGDYYIADTGNHRVRRVSPTGIITTIAGYLSLAGTARGYSGDGGYAAQALLDSPAALARDAAGYLYIADTGNNRIRRIDLAGLITTVAGPELSAPRGVAVDPAGAVTLADTGNHRLLHLERDGTLTTIAGTGLPGFTGDGGPATEARLNSPAGLALNAAGDLLVADTGNHRLRRLSPDGVIPPPAEADPQLHAVHPASQRETALAPNMILTLYGPGLGPAQARSATAPHGRIELSLADTEVSVNGVAAPILYTSDSQINLITPQRIGTGGKALVEVRYRGLLRASASFALAEAVPGLVEADADGQIAVVLADGAVASALRPVPRGQVVTLYLTGAGRVSPELADGLLPLAAPYPSPVLPAEIWIGGVSSPIQWIGTAPGYPGLIQINVRTPIGFLASGRQPVQIRIGQNYSRDGTFLLLE